METVDHSMFAVQGGALKAKLVAFASEVHAGMAKSLEVSGHPMVAGSPTTRAAYDWLSAAYIA